MDLIVDDLITNVNVFLSLNESSNANSLAKLMLASLKLKREHLIKSDSTLPNVKLFDLTQPLEPAADYEKIKCKQSSKFIVKTILCVHDLARDTVISRHIWEEKSGVFEEATLKLFTNYLAENPDWLVIDLGSHIGRCFVLLKLRLNHLIWNIKKVFIFFF